MGEEPTGQVQDGVVVSVVDGDTIDVDVNGTVHRIRYIGIDSPETHSGIEWMGPEASAANASLVSGRRVLLEKDVSETDQYGRLLRYVWVDDGSGWLLVNLELLRLGFAQVATYPPDVKYVDALYLPAERAARDAGTGLWGAPPTPAPTASASAPAPGSGAGGSATATACGLRVPATRHTPVSASRRHRGTSIAARSHSKDSR